MCKYQGEHPFVEINTTLLWGLKEILSLKDSLFSLSLCWLIKQKLLLSILGGFASPSTASRVDIKPIVKCQEQQNG